MDGVYSVEVLMKNPISTQAQPLQEFILDFQARTVVFRQHSQRFTRIEFRLLGRLFQQQSYLVPRQELLQTVWGLGYRFRWVPQEERTLERSIGKL